MIATDMIRELINSIFHTEPKHKQEQPKLIMTILGEDCSITKETIDNNNVLVCGSSGSGKSSRFVIPNILAKNASYIIADPGGNIYRETAKYMRSYYGGTAYDVKVLNLIDPYHSQHYNPLAYIAEESDIRYFAKVLSTASAGSSHKELMHGGDPYWNQTENILLQGLTFYLFEELDPAHRTLYKLNEIAKKFSLDDDYGNNNESEGVRLIKRALLQHGDIKSAEILGNVLAAPARTLNSILSTLFADMNGLLTNEVRELTRFDDIGLGTIASRPTALYVVYDETDPTRNVISNMLYMQCLRLLYHQAQNSGLDYPVRFLIDDFPNTNIPDFELYIRTCRKYRVSLCPILQSPSQLLEQYSSAVAQDIMSNCSMHLFTGSYDLKELDDTARLFDMRREDLQNLHRFEFMAVVDGRKMKVHGIVPEKQRWYSHLEPADIRQDITPDLLYKRIAFDTNEMQNFAIINEAQHQEQDELVAEKQDELLDVWSDSDIQTLAPVSVCKEANNSANDSALKKAINSLNRGQYAISPAANFLSEHERKYAYIVIDLLSDAGILDQCKVQTEQSLTSLFKFSTANPSCPIVPYKNTAEMHCDIAIIGADDVPHNAGKILAGIAVDGYSHDAVHQKFLDAYKDMIFSTAGVPLIRLPYSETEQESIQKLKDCVTNIANDIRDASTADEAIKQIATVVQPPEVDASGEYLEIKDLLAAPQIPHSSGKNHPNSKVKKPQKPNVQK